MCCKFRLISSKYTIVWHVILNMLYEISIARCIKLNYKVYKTKTIKLNYKLYRWIKMFPASGSKYCSRYTNYVKVVYSFYGQIQKSTENKNSMWY